MSITHIVDKVIKPDLENVFGPAMTARIIMSSRAKANAPIVGMRKEDFEKMIEAICCDDRVVGMWGSAGIHERRVRWKQALRSEQDS